MIILQETGTAQSFNFIPRSDTYNTLTITDEQTNESTNVTITTNVVGEYYNTITATFSLKEGHFYTLKLKQNTDVVFYDKVFCTNQSIPVFSVNDGQYTPKTSTNDFIIYE